MAVACPVCGLEIAAPKGIAVKGGFLITDRGSIPLGYTMETAMKALVRGPITMVGLVELVYGSRDNCPNNPGGSISVGLCRLKPRLVALGWKIINSRKGYHGAIYRLRKIEGTA